MPEISRFFGISIKMFYGDHMPPHFHAWYGEHKGVVDIQALVMIGGHLLAAGDLLDIIEHPNPEKYKGQRSCISLCRDVLLKSHAAS